MIDCGVVLGTSEPNVVMKQVAENVRKETGEEVDLLVITHEHWDEYNYLHNRNRRRPIAPSLEKLLILS